MNKRKTTLRYASAMAGGAMALLSAGAGAQPAPINSNLPPGALPSSWDPTYNVCRGTDPKCYRNWVDNRQNKVLIYSRTGGPRHANIGTALGAGKNTQNVTTLAVTCTAEQPGPPVVRGNCLVANNVAQAKLREWLNAEGIAADITEDVTQLSGLDSYKAVIFMSPTRDTMWKHGTAVATTSTNLTSNAHLDAAKTALRQYIRAGGGFVGIHNAFGTEYNWPYYEGLLGNANYYDHGANQSGLAKVVGSADPSTSVLPATFTTVDEWYNLMPYPTNVKFLLTLDETTLATRRTTHPGHGNFHPVSWCQYYDGGRSWVTTLGHDRRHFDDPTFPGQANFKAHVVAGIKSAMGVTDFCTK